MWPQILLTLEQRQLLTRVLCWLVIISAVLALALWLPAIALLLLSSEWAQAALWGFGAVMFVHIGAALLLTVWRSCDRCSFHLYPFRGGVWLDSQVHRSLTEARYPDYRAERFVGSFRWGAIVGMATKGVAHCMWCGHADGAKVQAQ
jgi:hypothetical protein